ncbi:alpha/beta hydrolase [Oceanihabitans sp. 2_MG-2023]|uniref:alpha/beta hydrolase n=1 Tax=Oceanihabitans sp. 2_MG-2023 TaxID=3062661 RepID=UPI0026E25C79|nr:alpha/beta hydrolase [Oceanihabitans sp. 2_MG-2023]MDO6597033.1 alpha/beta hydrolase [Oceanihabitans sp. 2_MG-2023]
MDQELIHVYLMPGMAANPTIFENIKLPKDKFQIHWLEWMIPYKNESISEYAKRMTLHIKQDNIVLLGVSFGGILVQEMSKHINLRKLIVVSSVKTMHELPNRMKIAKLTKAYKMLPTSLAGNIDALTKYTFGKSITKRIELYKKYMSVNNKQYLDWAIEQVVCWEQDKPIPGAIHIHGEKDQVFPHRHVCDCITIKGGTHIMIINKYKWFNENLPQLILQ